MFKILTSSLVAYKTYNYFNPNDFESQSSEAQNKSAERNAICIMFPDNNSGVKGLVSFQQKSYDHETQIVANLKGLSPNSLHGFHIHEFGDLTNGCTTAGGHFNPFNKTHGGPQDDERHVGDLGNLKTNEYGHGYLATTDKMITLFGEHSVVGRACVVHEKTDDLGRGGNEESKKTGNAGKRLACGIIGLAKEFKNLPPPSADVD